jgi:hypothetical protein
MRPGTRRFRGARDTAEGVLVRPRRLIVCLAAVTLALSLTGTAAAVPLPELTAPPSGEKATAPAAREHDRALPFSGVDLVLLAAGGAPLLALGAGLRRRRAAATVSTTREDSLTLA